MLGSRKKFRAAKVDTLVGRNTVMHGDVSFSGGLHVDGVIRGNVVASDDSHAMLTLSEHGAIEGEVRVPNVILNGKVNGDVYASERIELAVLAVLARVSGNVYYNLLEMAMGAEVNGSLLHRTESSRLPAGKENELDAGSESLPLPEKT